MGRLLLGVGRQRERGSPVCSTWDQRHLSGKRNAAEPRGAREADILQVATQLQGRTVCCDYREGRCRRNTASASVRVQAERLVSRRATARQSSISQLKFSEKQAKAISSRTAPQVACGAVVNAPQQYEWLASLATAKFERRWLFFALAHPPSPEMVRIHWGFTMLPC
jgi:hypothetical protein